MVHNGNTVKLKCSLLDTIVSNETIYLNPPSRNFTGDIKT